MDPRAKRHAEIIVDHCTDVRRGDEVLILSSPAAEDLTVALAEHCGRRGAKITVQSAGERVRRAYATAVDADAIVPSEMRRAAIEEADVVISIRASTNTHAFSDLDPAKTSAFAKANQEVRDRYLEKRWAMTQYPAPANAQAAEMSTAEYENFVWDAINKDWEAVRAHQEQLVEILEPADEIRIVSGDSTDVRMATGGNHAENEYGQENLPGGEVFTAPIPDSVQGEILFDKPLMAQGREIRDVRLRFEDGEVVDHAADKHEEVLTAVLQTDDGARRLGELGMGMNRDIDRFTYNMLFDEKMGDTVHMALGHSFEETVGEGNEPNDSAIHLDMIVDMSTDSFIEADGQIVQRDGTFVFEDGFEEPNRK